MSITIPPADDQIGRMDPGAWPVLGDTNYLFLLPEYTRQMAVKLAAAIAAGELTVNLLPADLPAGTTLTVWWNGGWPPRPTDLPSVVVQWCSVDYRGIPPTAIPMVDFLRVMGYQHVPDPDPDPPVVGSGTVLGSYTFEADTDGLSIAPASPWALGGSAGVFKALTAAKVHGSLGGQIERSGGSRWLQYTEAVAANTRVIECYFRIHAITGNVYIMQLTNSTLPSGTNRADWRINANRSVSLRDQQIAVASSGDEQLQPFDLYRASWMVSPAGQRLRIIRMSDGELAMDISGTVSNALSDRYQIGMMGGTDGTIIDYDTIRIGDDWLPNA